mgnify:CR=1 FL=1
MKRGSKIVLIIIGIIIGVFLISIGGVYIYGRHIYNKVENHFKIYYNKQESEEKND